MEEDDLYIPALDDEPEQPAGNTPRPEEESKAQEKEPAPPPPGKRENHPRWPRRRVVRLVCHALIILVLLLPFVDFLRVSLGRMFYPFEVEWLEGEVAVYAVRWQQEPSLSFLYPPYEEGQYVPHLYPPLYQIVLSEIQGFLGGPMLGLGRLLSFASVLTLMAAVAFIVREATHSWWAAAGGALLYPIFFKASGFWYDLVRVDSFAYALALWSVFFVVRRGGGVPSLLLGFAFGLLAHFSKQTAIFLPILAFFSRGAVSLAQILADPLPLKRAGIAPRGVAYLKHPYAVVFLVLPILLITLNLLYFIQQGLLGSIGFYLYEVGKSHNIFYHKIIDEGYQSLWQYQVFLAWMLPLGIWANGMLRSWKPWWEAVVALVLGIFVTGIAADYLNGLAAEWQSVRGLSIEGFLSPEAMKIVAASWPEPVRWAAAASLGGLVIWGLRWLLYRTVVPGAWWIGALFAAQHVALVTWVKIGGFVNNFIPLFAVQSVLFGLALAWIFRGARRLSIQGGTIAAGALVFLIVAASWFGTRGFLAARNPENSLYRRAIASIPPPERDRIPSWWVVDGLRYDTKDNPLGGQIPAESTEEWGPRLLDRIAELQEDGGVYLPHQNFLGHLAGVPIRPSIDSIRDVAYTGRPTPEPLLRMIHEREYQYIITMMDLRYEWMPGDFSAAMKENYELLGELLPEAPREAYRPVTGVSLRPELIYRAKE